jgi:hypothetical protein
MKSKLTQTLTHKIVARGAVAVTVMTALVAVAEAGKKW